MALQKKARDVQRALADLQQDEYSPNSPLSRRLGKLAYLITRGFMLHRAPQAAAALSFETVLALVPFLALVFGALKGFGVYRAFIDGTARPWIDRTFGAPQDEVVTLRDAFHRVLEFGDQADLSALGIIGTAVLVYLTVSLLVRVEDALNHVFGAERARSVGRRIADYGAIFFIVPVSIFVATAFGRWTSDVVGTLGQLATELVTVVIICATVLVVYLVMPHRKVRFRSALAGASFSGVAWYSILQLYAFFQVGVSNYNALYSGFAAVPLFLAFVLVSWNTILAGAELAAAVDDPSSYAWRVEAHRAISPAKRRHAAVRVVLAVASAFEEGAGPLSTADLATATGIPREQAREIGRLLVDRGLLVRGTGAGRSGLVPSRPLHNARVTEIIEAIEHPTDTDPRDPVAETLADLERAARESGSNVTVADLAERA